jgi:hypothetical protein
LADNLFGAAFFFTSRISRKAPIFNKNRALQRR